MRIQYSKQPLVNVNLPELPFIQANTRLFLIFKSGQILYSRKDGDPCPSPIRQGILNMQRLLFYNGTISTLASSNSFSAIA
jgi:hypothetical protein